ncbi:MAG: SpoIIIAC/SpoIIIAD family protein [Clostridia bacterium]
MNIFTYGILAIITAIFALILKKNNQELSLTLSIAGISVLFVIGIEYVDDIVKSIKSLEDFEYDYINIPLKILGLNIFTKICQSICEDANEKGLSVSVGILSEFACVLIAFPLFEDLLEQIKVILYL